MLFFLVQLAYVYLALRKKVNIKKIRFEYKYFTLKCATLLDKRSECRSDRHSLSSTREKNRYYRDKNALLLRLILREMFNSRRLKVATPISEKKYRKRKHCCFLQILKNLDVFSLPENDRLNLFIFTWEMFDMLHGLVTDLLMNKKLISILSWELYSWINYNQSFHSKLNQETI